MPYVAVGGHSPSDQELSLPKRAHLQLQQLEKFSIKALNPSVFWQLPRLVLCLGPARLAVSLGGAPGSAMVLTCRGSALPSLLTTPQIQQPRASCCLGNPNWYRELEDRVLPGHWSTHDHSLHTGGSRLCILSFYPETLLHRTSPTEAGIVAQG